MRPPARVSMVAHLPEEGIQIRHRWKTPSQRLRRIRALLHVGMLDVGLPRRMNYNFECVFWGDGDKLLYQDGVLATLRALLYTGLLDFD